jgi:hypothetical protein
MIKKFRLSFWIFNISLVFLMIYIVGTISEALHYAYPILLIIVYVGGYFSPVALLLLFVDIIFNRESKKKYFILAIIMNLIFLGFVINFAKEFSESFTRLIF